MIFKSMSQHLSAVKNFLYRSTHVMNVGEVQLFIRIKSVFPLNVFFVFFFLLRKWLVSPLVLQAVLFCVCFSFFIYSGIFNLSINVCFQCSCIKHILANVDSNDLKVCNFSVRQPTGTDSLARGGESRISRKRVTARKRVSMVEEIAM